MITSRERILVTHVGSLPRNNELSDLLVRREEGQPVDAAQLSRAMDGAVRHVVERQAAAGVDVVNDGEQPRVGFQTYVAQRMTGFGGESKRPRSPDYTKFPVWAAQLARRFPRRAKVTNAPQAVAEVAYDDLTAAQGGGRRFREALDALDRPPVEAFMTAASPGII